MRVIKYEHSGIAIEKDGKFVVCDPVEFTEKLPKFSNVVAIVITHKHSDHFQPEIVNQILNENPEAKIFTTNETDLPKKTVVKAGDIYEVEGFKLEFFGKDHAAIVPGQIPCESIGAVVDDLVVNPGDSFDLPNIQANVLLVPVAAPWLKTYESMSFVERAKPKIVIPIHDAIFSELGKAISGNWMKRTCESVGAKYAELKSGEEISV